jgi:PAS domain S-box-containing protein
MQSIPPELAVRIVQQIRGYAVIIMRDDGTILRLLGDAARVLGVDESAAVGRNIAFIFTPSDQADGAHLREAEIARRTGTAEDSRWHLTADGRRFWANGLTMPIDEGVLLKVFRDETRLKVAEEQRVLLLNELNHRVKNTLSTVQSVAEQALRSANVSAEVRADLAERLIAVSRVHDVLVQQSWAGADLEAIVRDTLAPYPTNRFSIDGPNVRLHPSQAVTLALILHELTTNALKHGALASPAGQVQISWNEALEPGGHRHLSLLWREVGGPAVSPPTRKGFGSRLLKQAAVAMSGSAEVTYEPCGVTCVLSIGLADEALPFEETLLQPA